MQGPFHLAWHPVDGLVVTPSQPQGWICNTHCVKSSTMFLVLAVLCFCGPLHAQGALDSYRIKTYAGSDPIRDGGPASDALLDGPEDVAVDSQGAVYIVDRLHGLIRRVDPASGVITTVVGSVTTPQSEGLATELEVDPVRVAITPDGALGFCTTVRVYRVEADHTVKIIAGTGAIGNEGDGGPATAATFGILNGLAFAPDGSYYLSDSFQHVIRKVGPDGVIERYAGTGVEGFSGDGGPASAAQLDSPGQIDLDADGNLYIVDRGNLRIRRVAADGTISTVTGDGTTTASGLGGPAVDGAVGIPTALATAAGGSLFVSTSNQIFAIDAGGVLNRMGGAGGSNSGDGGPLAQASFRGVYALAVEPDGTLLIVDRLAHRVRRVGPDQIVTTLAGKDHLLGDGGPANEAQLFSPQGLALDADGSLYVADSDNRAVRKISSDGVITTVAGSPTSTNRGDGGPAVDATLSDVVDVAIHPNGELYLLDQSYRSVRRIDANGTIMTVAGGGSGLGEGVPATQVSFNLPTGLTFDKDGNFYITDLLDSVVRKVDTNGIITTVAGNGTRGFSGDGGPAVAAQLDRPQATVAADDGTLYIAEWLRVRQVAPDGTISTLAELPTVPDAMSMTPAGDLLVVNSSNSWLLRVRLDGSVFDMHRMILGFSGDGGVALDARASHLVSAVEHPDGRIFISDRDNHRVRVLTPFPVIASNGILHAASFFAGAMAADTIVSVFGNRLANEFKVAETLPLPTTLGGTTVVVRDSAGVEREAPLFFVSSKQLNLLIPPGTAQGDGLLILRTDQGDQAETELSISSAAPGLFTANANGSGVAAGFSLRVAADGTKTTGLLYELNAGATGYVEKPLSLGPEGEQVYLLLYGTGIRGAGGAERIEATIGGQAVGVLFAGEQGDFVGLDQVNLGPIPRGLTGTVEVSIRDRSTGLVSNPVTVRIE